MLSQEVWVLFLSLTTPDSSFFLNLEYHILSIQLLSDFSLSVALLMQNYVLTWLKVSLMLFNSYCMSGTHTACVWNAWGHKAKPGVTYILLKCSLHSVDLTLIFASLMWGKCLKYLSTPWRTPRLRAISCPWCSTSCWSVMIIWPGIAH